MVPDPRYAWAIDERPTDALVALYLAEPDTDDGQLALGKLHYRGGAAEFAHGARLAKAATEDERVAGACILSQLGFDERTHLEESVAILVTLLNDASDSVIAAAATALHSRQHASAVSPLLELVRHPNSEVRWGVVYGLTGHDDPAALAALVELTRDVDRDVRDWATFGIGTQTNADSPDLREALFARTKDNDPEVRGEGLIGLALRGDARALPLVRAELQGEFHGDWAVEAAEYLAEPSLHPFLERLHEGLDAESRRRFRLAFEYALEACRPKP